MEQLRANLQALGLPLRTLEVEFGPSQIELTFGPAARAWLPADQMILIRSAVKQTCARHGMVRSPASWRGRVCRTWCPADGICISRCGMRPGGECCSWPAMPGRVLSGLGHGLYGGACLAHAGAACAFTTPTINGYKRYRPYTNAPTRACWASANRGVMVRVLGRGRRSRPRGWRTAPGEPGANPYLAMAAQIAVRAGWGGAWRWIPGPAADAPYESGDAPALPRSLMEALQCGWREDGVLYGRRLAGSSLTISPGSSRRR